MGSRVYAVTGANITVANQAVTLVIINPLAGTALKVIRAWVDQHASTTSAQQRIVLGTKATAFGTYTAATPQKISSSDPASGIAGGTAGAAGTSGINASAEGAGTLTPILSRAFNVLSGFEWVSLPEDVIEFSAKDSLAFVMQFPAAPTSLTGWNFGVEFREIG